LKPEVLISPLERPQIPPIEEAMRLEEEPRSTPNASYPQDRMA
jgi:hypothetical protein